MSNPSGLLGDGHSESGVSYYTDVLNTMLVCGITPLETLYHRDLPQGLLDAPGRMEHLQVAQVPRGDQGFPFGLVQRHEICSGHPRATRSRRSGRERVRLNPDFCFRAYPEVKHWSTFNEACRLEGTTRCVAMTNHLVDALLGWFMHPIYGTPDSKGSVVHDYPSSMRSGPHTFKCIPEFTAAKMNCWVQHAARSRPSASTTTAP